MTSRADADGGGSSAFCSLVPAAGLGRRLGEDKALVDLGGEPAIERIVGAHRRVGAEWVGVVRRSGALPLPAGLDCDRKVEVDDPAEMIDSLRAGWRALPAATSPDVWVVFHPVDYPLAADAALRPLTAGLRSARAETAIVLPRCGSRVGHPIALRRSLETELFDPNTESLRDLIRRDRARVDVIDVDEPWVLRDVDDPADLHAARTWLARGPRSVSAWMRGHRSRRSFLDVAVPEAQLEWIVDAARHCSTSSFMQACSVVAVRDPETKRRCAALCADQRHLHEAPVFLAICADLHRVGAACARHEAALQADSLEVFVTATVDAALVGQNIQLAAEAEGLGACMIGAARNHPVELAKVLELPPHVYVVFGMALGFPVDDPLPRGRLPLGAVLHHDRYDAARVADDLEAADEGMRAWARRTNAEKGGYGGRPVHETRGWTDRMARLWGQSRPPKGRADLASDLRALGFGLEAPRDDLDRDRPDESPS